MASIIIYSTDKKYLDRTIDSVVDGTVKTLIDEIVVCDDTGAGDYARPGVKLQVTNRIGRAKAFNQAANASPSTHLVFMRDKCKVGTNCLSRLLAVVDGNPQSLVSPVTHTLDLSLWSSENSRWRRFGWRWDMNVHDRAYSNSPTSPAASTYCMVCTTEWFHEIGGFDDGMGVGAGEDIEISLRSWLFGGSVLVNDDASIAVALEVDYEPNTANNLARMVEVWLPNYAGRFYRARGLDPKMVTPGRLGNLLRLQDKQTRPVEWFLTTQQPELLGVYELAGSAHGKHVAVVGPGPSLDFLPQSMINRHDLVIGVDYAGLLYDCDYVVADASHVVNELQKKYDDQKFILPVVLQERVIGQMAPTSELVPLAYQFEYGQIASLEPPFGNFENLVLSAVQVALFMGAATVTVYGFDNKILAGRSHTSRVEFYDGGRLWPDSEATRRRFAGYEYGLDQLGRLALSVNVPLMRVCHG
jgi:hypothetical protein